MNPFQSLRDYEEFVAQPHPDDSALASTYPHHKHIPPDVKRHRIPAPNMGFTQPNLPALIREMAKLLEEQSSAETGRGWR